MIERQFAHLEFQASTSSPAAIAKTIRTCGCALIRGAIAPPVMTYLGDVMPLMFRYIDVRETYAKFALDQPEAPKPFHASLIRFDILPSFSKILEMEVLDFLFGAINQSILAQVSLEYFSGQVFGLRSKMSIARRQSPVPDEYTLPFHQDGTNYVDLDFLNFWIPATRAGSDAPGLELVPVAIAGSLEVTKGPSIFPTIELDEATLADRFGRENFFHPVMEPCDVLVMNQHTIHRTYMPPGATRERCSFEVRVSAA